MERDIEIIKKKMKNQKILVVLLSIVLVLSIGVSGYFIYDSMKEDSSDNNTNNEINSDNNNVDTKKTSLEILNDLIEKGLVKETNFNEMPHSNKDYAYYINNKGQLVITNDDKEFICDEIEGKVSKVGAVVGNGYVKGFFVITEDGNLYITGEPRNSDYDYFDSYVRIFERVKLPSSIVKIYDAKNTSQAEYYILLKNNEVYELSPSSVNNKLGEQLSENSFVNSISVHAYHNDVYPCIHIAYNGKVFFANYDTISEIKDENNNSFSANYVIANGIKDKQQDNYQYFNAFIVDKNNEIYIISKITQNYDGNGVIKTNTKSKKYSSKKVKTVSNDSDDNQVIVTYVDGSKEKLDGYYISMNK